jgi:hypothetical protein
MMDNGARFIAIPSVEVRSTWEALGEPLDLE